MTDERSPAESIVPEPTYGCDCIDKSNGPDGLLAKHNTELDVTWQIDRRTGAVTERIALQTSVVTKKRGARPARIIPTYCPICGNRYEPPADDEMTPDAPRPEAGQGGEARHGG
jgi:hypothetical protein